MNMKMNFIVKRVLSVIPVLFGISIITFSIAFLAPGDPAEMTLDQNGIYFPTQEQIEQMRVTMGVDASWHRQYFSWIKKALYGDLGHSYHNKNSVLSELRMRVPVTLQLAVPALLLTGLGGIILGTLCALDPKTLPIRILSHLFDIFLATPRFLLALLLIFVMGEILRLLPTSGVTDYKGYLLPTMALSITTIAVVGRLVKNKLAEEIRKPYCFIALAHGIQHRQIVFLYALPNIILPIIAILGNFFGEILGGSIIIENIFALPGLGSMAIEAIRFRDYPLLQGYVLFTGCTYVLISLVLDLLLYLLNPKIRFEEY